MRKGWLVDLAKVFSDIGITGLTLACVRVWPELLVVKLALLAVQALLVMVRPHARVVN